MSEKRFIYQGKIDGVSSWIYFIHNNRTGKNQYHLVRKFSKEIINDPKKIREICRDVDDYNKKHNKKIELFSTVDKAGKKHYFRDDPCLAVEAIYYIMKSDKGIMPVFQSLSNIVQENKSIQEENGKQELRSSKSGTQTKTSPTGVVASSKHYKKPDKMKSLYGKVIAFGMAGLLAISVAGLIGREISVIGSDDNYGNEPAVVQPISPENDFISEKDDSSILEPEQPMEPQLRPYIDYDSLEYDTYKNSAGTTMIEVCDAIEIADVCFNNIVRELSEYNKKVSDAEKYSFDVEKFNSLMFVGEQIRESSLKEYVSVGGNVKNSPDYGDKCRGPFKIGPDGIKEANEVSRNLIGEDIIRNEQDLYDVVRATRACMYVAIKNYYYCAKIVEENVSPNMVFDSYLYGCGNVRKWLRQCIVDGKYNGKYKPKEYSIDIMYYSDCLKDYKEKLLRGKTDGSHDNHWRDLHVNGLWKVEEFKQAQKGSEPEA